MSWELIPLLQTPVKSRRGFNSWCFILARPIARWQHTRNPLRPLWGSDPSAPPALVGMDQVLSQWPKPGMVLVASALF